MVSTGRQGTPRKRTAAATVPAAGGRAPKAAHVKLVMALNAYDDYWAPLFGEDEFLDRHYRDLFAQMWVRQDLPMSRSDAYLCMKSLSAQTAMKYVNRAVERGYLQEVENPDDRRSRLLVITPLLMSRVGTLLDYALDEFRKAL
jgi:hypothetical protein